MIMKKKFVMLFLCMVVALTACGKAENEEQVEKNNTDVAVGDKTSEITQENVAEVCFEGTYASYDTDEPMLFISKNEDGSYSIQVGVYRLIQLDNCIGTLNGNQLDFSTTEWGEEQEITGTITLDSDVVTVMFSAPWSDTWFKDVNEYQYYKLSDSQSQSTENEHTETIAGENDEAEVESIQDEIARVEEQSREIENADWGSMGQQQMNQLSAQWYQLWDDELNSLWSRLSKELDAETKAKVLTEQRAWIKQKEGNVTAAGLQALGGTLQPLLESTTAYEMTRARVYILAGYLADVRNESFTISLELQESIDAANPSLDEVFAKIEGQWIFDESRGACVGIERTETCAYGVEGSNWTVWVTGGDLISDLDVIGYTESNILFKVACDGYDVFYEISLTIPDELVFSYGTALDAMDEILFCE